MNDFPYELAVELEQAGFPQTGAGHMENENGYQPFGGIRDNDGYGNFVYFPTLEELIEGCGSDFDLLTHDPNFGMRGKLRLKALWWATSWSRKEEGGSTPSEAVARLYLALNKK